MDKLIDAGAFIDQKDLTAIDRLIKDDARKNPLASLQVTNPFTLEMTPNPADDLERSAYRINKERLEKPFDLDLNELIPVIKDILAGDANAKNIPQYSCLNLANIKAALDWLYANNQLNDGMKAMLAQDSWKLAFRAKPPTGEEFLGYKYIGPQSETLYDPVRDAFIEAFNPMRPYRTMVLTPCIGWGKSLFTVLANLYIAVCTSLMWHPYKFFGQSQPLDCEVWTTSGPKKMGDVKVGDKVLTPSGKETDVIEIHPQGKIPTYEIELDDGRKTRCSAQHLWKVSYRRGVDGEKVWETVNTQFMIDHPELEFEIPDYTPKCIEQASTN